MPEKTALVIPADEAKPAYEITWGRDEELLAKLYAEIRCTYVEASPSLQDASGEALYFWLDEMGRISDPPQPSNPRATALAMVVGWHPGMLLGNVALTGGADDDGNTLGLSQIQREALTKILTRNVE